MPAAQSVCYRHPMTQRKPKGPRLLASVLGGTETTKTEIAAALGMSIEQLRHIEAGRRSPTLSQAVALEDGLRIPVRFWLA